MEQNSFFWLLPKCGEPVMLLGSGERAVFDLVQCFDGRYSYDVWVYGCWEEETALGLSLDGRTLYEAMRIQASGEKCWRQLGNLQATKGEHRVVLTNAGSGSRIEGFLICRDGGYVQNGTAKSHLERIVNGEDILSVLEEEGLLEQQRETAEEKEARLRMLKEYGFLERMDQDASEGRCRCGVPMGGIGAGKIELDSEGVLTAITVNNNCEVPIYRTKGSFFAAWAKDGEKTDAFVLQTADPGDNRLPLADRIAFRGRFPRAELSYGKDGFPAKISLRAFSALVPYSQKDSSLPAAIYTFTVENTQEHRVEAAVLFSFENLIGTGGSMAYQSKNPDKKPEFIMNSWNPGYVWCDRRGNRQRAEESALGKAIYFDCAEGDHGDPASFGDYTLLCVDDGAGMEISRRISWDTVSGGKELWEDFAADGVLEPGMGTAEEKQSLRGGSGAGRKSPRKEGYPAAAAAAKLCLEPLEKREITFVFAWNMPCYPDASGKDMGVYYSNFFASSAETAHYAASNKERLYEETIAFERCLQASTLPDWLQEKLINDRFPIYTCSWFTKDGKFAINEAPAGMMGCLGTMDQRLACNSLYTNFFPALDRKELTLFADAQGEDGSISHDLGFGEFVEGPRRGNWSDLCSSFILQVYKHYQYTADRGFLERMYEKVKRAVEYQLSTDEDKNGIPDVGAGKGTTYDTYHWYGTSAFVASLWLAELAVCGKMAEAMGDAAFGRQCEGLRMHACAQMEKELWTTQYGFGAYYKNYHDRLGGRISENCFIAQLAGEWFTALADVESGLPKEHVEEALRTIYRRNVDFKDIVIMNDETTPEGDFFGFGYTFLQYDEVYYGCLAISRDLIRQGMRVFEKVWERTKQMQWNIGLTYYTDGRFCGLPYYMTNPASLFLLDALGGWMPDAAEGVLKVFPHTEEQELRLPLFSPALWLMLDHRKQDGYAEYKLTVLRLPDADADSLTGCPSEKGRAGKTEGERRPAFKRLVLRADFPVKMLRVNGEETAFSQKGNRVTVPYDFRPACGETLHILLRSQNVEKKD